MSDDLISRQAAINALEELKELDYELYIRTSYSHLMEDQWDFVIKRYKEAIKKTPCVQPKTGHWICDYKGDHVADYHCSECGRQLGFAFSTQNKKILGGRWKYCDVCGAKMKGETE